MNIWGWVVQVFQATLKVSLWTMRHHVVQAGQEPGKEHLGQLMRQKHRRHITESRGLRGLVCVWGPEEDPAKTKQVQSGPRFVYSTGRFWVSGNEPTVDVLHESKMGGGSIVQLHLA